MKKLLWLGSFSYLATGFSHVLIGSILVELLGHYGGAYSQGGGLVFAQFFGFLIGVSISGAIVRYLGKRTLLVTAFAVMASAQIYSMTLPSWELLVASLFIMGIAFGAIESSIGALILMAFKDNPAPAMGRLELFFGLGALLMPFFSGLFLYFNIWRAAFLPLGLVALILAAAWKVSNFGGGSAELLDRSRKRETGPEVKAEAEGKEQSRGGKAGARNVLTGFAVFFFLYVGMEVCLIEFAPSWMMEDFSVSPSASAWSVTVYWLMMSMGRGLIGALSARISNWRYLVFSIGGTLMGTVGLAVSPSAAVAYLWMAVLGFAMSALFAIALIYANSLAAGREQLTASLLIASGGVGGAVMPFALGKWMDRFGTNSSVWLLAGAVGVMLAIILVTPAYVRSRELAGSKAGGLGPTA